MKEVKEGDVLEKIWIPYRKKMDPAARSSLGNRLDVPRISRDGLTPRGRIGCIQWQN